MASNAFRNVLLAERDQALKEHGDYGIVQVDSWSNNGVTQNLGTGYVDISNSSRNFTPKYSDSVVTYEFTFLSSYVDTFGIMHTRIYYNGAEQTAWRATFSADNYSNRNTLHFRTNSWGAGVTRNIKAMIREYGASNEQRAGITNHWDGGGTDVNSASFGRIIEWRAPPETILDWGA